MVTGINVTDVFKVVQYAKVVVDLLMLIEL